MCGEVDHFGVSDLFAVVCRGIFKADEEEGVGAFDTFYRAIRRGANLYYSLTTMVSE